MVLFFSTLTMISAELQHRAQIEYDENKLEVASVTLEQARLIMPMNSSLFHDFGDINLALFHRRHDARFLEAATSSFRQAIALSPEKVGPHIGLGLCLSSANRVDEALEELRLAKRLQPGSRQVSAISRLMEKRNERASK
jgi:tetratricopeptide (TPR) repeat protein